MMADEETAKFIGGVAPRPLTWRALMTMIGVWHAHGFAMFSVFEKASGRWVGRLGSVDAGRMARPRRWGWTIVRDCWGRGYATEGAAAATDWAFDHLGLDGCDRQHRPSPRRLANRGSQIGVAESRSRIAASAVRDPSRWISQGTVARGVARARALNVVSRYPLAITACLACALATCAASPTQDYTPPEIGRLAAKTLPSRAGARGRPGRRRRRAPLLRRRQHGDCELRDRFGPPCRRVDRSAQRTHSPHEQLPRRGATACCARTRTTRRRRWDHRSRSSIPARSRTSTATASA